MAVEPSQVLYVCMWWAQHLSAEPCYVLAAADLKHVMTSIGEKLTAEQAESMMTEADVDGGGKLNCEGLHALV